MKPKNIQTRFGAFFDCDGKVITVSAKFKECPHSWRFVERTNATTNLAFDCREIFDRIPGHETEREAVAELLERAHRSEQRVRTELARLAHRITNAAIWLGGSSRQAERDAAFADGTIPVTPTTKSGGAA